jgi:hypothetical protein
MKSRVASFALFLLLPVLASTQQPSHPRWLITLSIANPMVAVGAPIDVAVVEKNIGRESAARSTLCNAMLDYKFTVLGPGATPVKPTRLYERMLNGPGVVIECAVVELTVAPGEEFKLGENIALYFEMTAPGKYVLQATRDSVSSNKLEITIAN